MTLNRRKATLKKHSCALPNESCKLSVIVSDSFDDYAERGWFVFDVKNSGSNTWGNQTYSDVSNGFHVFSNEQDPFDFKAWEPVLKPLIEDMIKLYRHGVRIGIDNKNYVAILNSSRQIPAWTLRYFGFDFSGKYGGQPIPNKKIESLSPLDLRKVCAAIKTNIQGIVGVFASTVFDVTWDNKKHKQREESFIGQLEERFSDCDYIVSSFSIEHGLEEL